MQNYKVIERRFRMDCIATREARRKFLYIYLRVPESFDIKDVKPFVKIAQRVWERQKQRIGGTQERATNLVSYLGDLKLEKWIFFSSPSWFLITKASALTHSITCFQIAQHNGKRFSWLELLYNVQTSCLMNFRFLCISITRCQWCPLDPKNLICYCSIGILVMVSVREALCEMYIRKQEFNFWLLYWQSLL